MNAEPSRQQMHRRYRRRILGWGAVAFLVVLVLGSVITLPRVESELEDRVDTAAAAAGLDGVTSSFSGQNGTLACATPDDVPSDELLAELGDLRGVHTIVRGDTCGGPAGGAASEDDDGSDTIVDLDEATEAPASAVTGPAVTTPPDTTASDDQNDENDENDEATATDSVLDVVGNDSQFSTLRELIDDAGIGAELSGDGPITLFAPTNDAFQALGPDSIAALGRDPDLLNAVLRHHLTASDVPTDDFVRGDLEMLDGTSVSISPGEAGVDAAITSGEVIAAITAADIFATNGVVHAVDAVLLPPGFELPDASTAIPTTVPPPVEADENDAARLEAELNAFVAANPILFDPGSATIAASSQPVIDQVATLAGQLTGINIEVQGHTDTDGNPGRNQTLSENRAASVRDALIEVGVDATTLTSTGFGGTRTVVDAAGVENKAASRRVEFVVTTA